MRTKEVLVLTAEFYGEPMSDSRLEMFASILGTFDPRDVEAAVRQLMADPKVTRMPLPAAIAALIRPPNNPDADALDAAHRISEAMVKFGNNRANEARAFIGELGWMVVQRQGGWLTLCADTQVSAMPTLKAQWRELAKAIQDRARRGVLDEPPQIPSPVEREALPKPIGTLLASTLKDALPGGSR